MSSPNDSQRKSPSKYSGSLSPKSSDIEKPVPLPQAIISLLSKKGFIIGKEINSGSFSIVCRAKMNAKDVAVKIIDLEKTSKDYREKFLPRELYTLRKLKHPYIITIFDIFTIDNRIFVFMEWADGGDILDMLKNGPIPEGNAKILYKQICEALRYVHSNGIAHRDIKSENVLINKRMTVAKMTDFGFSRTTFDNATGKRMLSETYCGSAAYVAPEVLKAMPYNPIISDCWSMGVVLFVMLNSKLPFNDNDLKRMLKKQLNREFTFYNNTLSETAKSLIKKHLEPDVNKRITMQLILVDPWIKDVTL